MTSNILQLANFAKLGKESTADYTLGRSDSGKLLKQFETSPSVSVVISAYNEEEVLQSCLDSILATKYPDLEIIVVDDASEDGTAHAASSHDVKLVRRSSRGGIAAARNDGLRIARGEIVAFVDADCTVDKDWLNFLISDYIDNSIVAVGGVIKTKKSGIVASYRQLKEREKWAAGGVPTETWQLPGGNCSYRAEMMRRIGGFDAAFSQPRGYEQFEVCHRLRKLGYKVVGEPRAVVWHDREDSLKAWCILSFDTGYSALSFLPRYRFREIRGTQLKQVGFIVVLVLFLLGLIGVVQAIVAFSLVGALFLVEFAAAAYSAGQAVVYYRNPKYLLMLPAEIVLMVLNLSGYTWALLTAVFRWPQRQGRRAKL
jgi:glycosyltransferase involved in cell wall biosynthesis